MEVVAFPGLQDATSTVGAVQGQAVVYTYHKSDDETRLDYTKEDGVSDSITGDSIIAILSIHSGLPNDYVLLYAAHDPQDASSKPEESTYLRSLILSSPPPVLVNDFAPGGLSCWQLRSTPSTQATPTLFVVISTQSGHNHAEACFNNLVQPFLEIMGLKEGTNYEVLRTESTETISQLTCSTILPRANEGLKQAIILLAGDGGIVDIINALYSDPSAISPKYKKPNIALLPLGTGNALAHSTNITRDKTLGLSTLVRGSPHPLPLFRASFSSARPIDNDASTVDSTPPFSPLTVHGAVVLSWGLHAALVADSDTPAYRKLGAIRFQKAAQENLYPSDGSALHSYQGSISTQQQDDSSTEWHPIDRTSHVYVLLTLVSQLEKGFTISPSSRPLDGQLRLVHFGPQQAGGDGVMKIMMKAYQAGAHVTDEQVGYDTLGKLRITFDDSHDRWHRVCVDGKIYVVEKGASVEVEREEFGVLDLVHLDS